MKPIEFTHLSKLNDLYPKKTVILANGAKFVYLDLPQKDKLNAANVLYLHINRDTLKCYIGITIMKAGDRWGAGTPYRNNRHFGNAIQAHGWEKFESYILAFAENREALNIAEAQAIAAAGGHKSKFTYNISPGGDIVAENDKAIVGIFLPTGKVFDFKSGADAARKLGLGSVDYPMNVARGEMLSVKDWWFRFKDDATSMPPALWGESLRLQKMREINSKPLVGINYKTKEVRYFPTQQVAADELGVNQSEVCAVASGNLHSTGGWWFRYEEDKDRPMPTLFGTLATRQKRDKKVYAVHLKTGMKHEFPNCTLADHNLEIHVGAAASVASGGRVSSHDWWFTYDPSQKPPNAYKWDLVAIARSKAVIAENIEDGSLLRFDSAKSAAEALSISRSMISMIIKGKRKSAKGYTFREA